MTAPQPDTETLVAIVSEALNDSDDGDPTMYAQKAISALDALAARLAEAGWRLGQPPAPQGDERE